MGECFRRNPPSSSGVAQAIALNSWLPSTALAVSASHISRAILRHAGGDRDQRSRLQISLFGCHVGKHPATCYIQARSTVGEARVRGSARRRLCHSVALTSSSCLVWLAILHCKRASKSNQYAYRAGFRNTAGTREGRVIPRGTLWLGMLYPMTRKAAKHDPEEARPAR